MISQLSNLNWIGVLIAFLAYFMLSALWFTLFFNKQYKISLGKGNEILPKKPIFIIGPAICSLVITLACSIFIYSLNLNSISEALEFSILVGVGFLFANTINIAINPNIPKPISYGIISGTFHLVGITIVSVILIMLK